MLTALDASQTQLQASEVRFRLLVDLAPEPIIIHDGVAVRFCNPAGAALLGEATPAAYVGTRLAQFAGMPTSLFRNDAVQ